MFEGGALLLPSLTALAVAGLVFAYGSKPVRVEALSVPAALSEAGFGGEVAAARLMDSIREIAGRAGSALCTEETAVAPEPPHIAEQVASALSLDRMVGLAREMLGWDHGRIRGEIVEVDATLEVR